MVYVLVEHRIGGQKEFERIFKDDGERRRRLGSKGGRVFRNVNDSESLFVIFEWNDLQGATRFAEGLETHEAMEWATSGVWSRIHVVDELYEVDA